MGIIKQHPKICAITASLFSIGIGWGVSMMLPSTPHNGISIIVLTLAFIFLIWGSVWVRHLKQKRRNTMIFGAGIVLIVLGIAVVISQLDFKTEAQAVSPIQHEITPSIEQSPKITSLRDLPTFVDGNQEVTVKLGMMNMKGRVTELMNNPHQFKVDDYSILSFYISNHTLYVDTTLYGGAQMTQVELKENILVSRPMNWDFNSDGRALEIVNDRQEPIFQLVYKTQYSIAINGYLYFPGGFVFVHEDGRTIMNPKIPPVDYTFTRIFQYPSSEYQGMRIK